MIERRVGDPTAVKGCFVLEVRKGKNQKAGNLKFGRAPLPNPIGKL